MPDPFLLNPQLLYPVFPIKPFFSHWFSRTKMEKHMLLRPDIDNVDFIKPYQDLSGSETSEDTLEKLGFTYKEPIFWRRNSKSIIVHSLLVLANIAICLLFFNYAKNLYAHGPGVRYSPATKVIEYEPRQMELVHIYNRDGTLNLEKPTRFNGIPSPELEAEWAGLTQNQNLRLSLEELGDRASDDGLIELPDGGYFGTLTVYHSLHCVKRLHMYMYYDYYYADLNETEHRRLKHHAEHCLDTLRQNIQCAADTTLMPFHWGTKQRVPLSHDDGQHECVNWKKLDGWAAEHSFNPFQPGYLVHPTFGLAYPNGLGDRLGIVEDSNLKIPGQQ